MFLLPVAAGAAVLAQSSEVVLVYDGAGEEDQGRHSFLYTIAGDDTIYPCDANRCDMSEYSERGAVDLTVYKLPEGFPRPQGIADQARLQEFIDSADNTYQLGSIQTDLRDTGDGKQFYTVSVWPDGTHQLNETTYDKADPNTPVEEEGSENEATPGWIVGLIVALVVVVLLAGGGLFYLRKTSK